MNTVAIALARMGSTRFPGKVLKPLDGQPVLEWVMSALTRANLVDLPVLATSTLPADDVIAEYCNRQKWACFRGDEEDVLDRFYQCAKHYSADIVLRVTCDCPFLDPRVIDEVIKLREITNAHYCSNVDPPTWPDGLDIECFTFTALEAAWRDAVRPSDRNCVTQFITRNRSHLNAANLTCPLPGLHKERWVLDTEPDYRFCCAVAERLKAPTSYLEVLRILDKEPELREINNANRGAGRNERFYESLVWDPNPPRSYRRSVQALERALKTIPFGAQTFSKSHLQFPVGHAPLFVSHGDGARIFDVDGNDYVDLVGALLPVILGYRDPDVDLAIRNQLARGISFSLATELEAELAETLVRIIPCAEMVKFGKNGTDVTSAAIRLARAYTGRDHVFFAGYHGWQDWSMAHSPRNLGIPEVTRSCTHHIPYGDEIFDKGSPPLPWPHQVAAIIVEPNDDPDYLQLLRRHCTKHGIVLIFDEIITGFRYELGGAQELYGVTPDLATFGKAMANGMPISALVGRRDIMKRMEPPDNIFYSGTFFGETLSIAAAIATIKKLEELDVPGHLVRTGIILEKEILDIRSDAGLEDIVSIDGWYPKQTISFHGNQQNQLRSLFIAKMAENGVLIINSNNLSYAHKEPEIEQILDAYAGTFLAIQKALDDGSIAQQPTVAASPIRMSAGE
jgi:glutamate-1-semialdehyde 2,1-aminomutase/spore coat polysaccharide biosynthesis protein SpsF